MKTLAILALSAALAGCASLNVSWIFTASYGVMRQSMTGVAHQPAPEAAPAPTPPASAPGKPS